MADLSKIKIANVTYGIKDTVARDKITELEKHGGSGGNSGKTSYLHIFEYYDEWSDTTFSVYVPMNTKEPQGEKFLNRGEVTCYWGHVDDLVIYGAFAIANNYKSYQNNYLFAQLGIEEMTYYEDPETGEYSGTYRLYMFTDYSRYVYFDTLTFVGEKVI